MKFIDFPEQAQQKDFTEPAESKELEYKLSQNKLSKSFWETVSAFANTDGGLIVLGVSEDKKGSYQVVGVKNASEIRTQIFNGNNNLECISRPIINNNDVLITTYEQKQLLQVIIHPEQYNSRPVSVTKGTYVRTDDGDRLATAEQLKYFAIERQGEIDTRLLNNFGSDDLEQADLQSYKALLKAKKANLTADTKEFLADIGVLKKDRTSNENELKLSEGGLLFFGKFNAIMDRFPRFQLDYMKYAKDSDIDWEDRVSVGDMNFPSLNIFSFYNIVLPKLVAGIDDKYLQDADLTRGTYYADLKLAAKEALVNALMHAYYDGDVAVKIVDRPSYFEFTNPGDMRVSKESFLRGQTSIIRNSQIALLFRKIGISEKAASGGPRILKSASNNHLLAPEIKVDNEHNFTTIRIWKVDALTLLNDKFELDKVQRFIIDYASRVKTFKFNDLIAKSAGTYGSQSKIRQRLNILVESGIINVTGKGRATFYQLLKTPAQKKVEKIMNLWDLEKSLY